MLLTLFIDWWKIASKNDNLFYFLADQIEISESKFLEEGLDKAGRYIGILERILVLTLVLFNQISAIGFLIAAKSILRYGDKDIKGARKQTEYVLIGTLMSFSSAIALGLLVRIIWF